MFNYIIIFILNLISFGFGFYLGLRSQKKKITGDVINLTEKLGKLPKKKDNQSRIVKAWTPEKFEEQRLKKFEKENY